MSHIQFPKWKYGVGKSLIVQTAAEESALEGDWFDSPADIPSEAPEAEEPKPKAKPGPKPKAKE